MRCSHIARRISTPWTHSSSQHISYKHAQQVRVIIAKWRHEPSPFNSHVDKPHSLDHSETGVIILVKKSSSYVEAVQLAKRWENHIFHALLALRLQPYPLRHVGKVCMQYLHSYSMRNMWCVVKMYLLTIVWWNDALTYCVLLDAAVCTSNSCRLEQRERRRQTSFHTMSVLVPSFPPLQALRGVTERRHWLLAFPCASTRVIWIFTMQQSLWQEADTAVSQDADARRT